MSTPDTNFTTWVNYPGTPSNPGASDLNRLQNNDAFFATPPVLRVTDGYGSISDNTLTVLTPWRTITESTATVNGVTFFTFNGSRVTFNVAGRWRYYVSIPMDAGNTTGYRQIRLVKNGSIVVDLDERNQTNATRAAMLKMSGPVRVAANEYLEVFAIQTSGVAASIPQTTYGEPFWALEWASL